MTDSPSSPSVSICRRVLVVEDNRDIRESLRMMLEFSGYECRGAATGIEALRMARSFGPSVVLLDIGLPDMSGLEVASLLRGPGGYPAARIIAVTAYTLDSIRDDPRVSCLNDHILKPIVWAELTEKLDTSR